VSNFSVAQRRHAIALSDAPILTNQVKYNPHHGQTDLLPFCIEEDVMLTAYSPLDVGGVLGDTVVEIGNQDGKTAPQVAIRWLIQQPMVSTIATAAEYEHIRENFAVFNFELTTDELRDIFEGTGGLDDHLARLLTL
jgi:diketogulonate reductase-like aldo/keto reductase